MSYQKQNFANGEVLTATQLNHIEDGIVDVESAVNETKGVVDKIIDPTLSVSGKAADAKATGDAIRGVKDDLTAETTRAKATEQANAKNISDEIIRAQAAEKVSYAAISSETARAQTAEQANAEAITTEKTRAEQAEQALSARTAAIESCGFVVVNGKICVRYIKR